MAEPVLKQKFQKDKATFNKGGGTADYSSSTDSGSYAKSTGKRGNLKGYQDEKAGGADYAQAKSLDTVNKKPQADYKKRYGSPI